jgi:nucleoside-diphosphate-sugar epimerase
MNSPGIFMLGSTGPTGEMVTQRLLADDATVVVLHRTDKRREEFEKLGATVMIGDATNREELFACMEAAAPKCSVVVNLLGGNPFDSPDNWPDYTGTVNAVDAAIDTGMQSMILVTSIGTGASLQWVPEESFLIPLLELKTKAEQYLQQSELQGLILKPGGLGRPGEDLTPIGKVLLTENHGVRGLLPREDLAATIVQVLTNFSDKLYGRELYIVADRIEEHAGKATQFEI